MRSIKKWRNYPDINNILRNFFAQKSTLFKNIGRYDYVDF